MMQRSNLVHVLASLSNLASTVEEKTLFLRNAISYDINYIETEPFSASMENFLNNTGLSFAPDLKAIASQSCPYYLSRLNVCLFFFYFFFGRVWVSLWGCLGIC